MTLSRYVPSDVNMGAIKTLALAPGPGNGSVDGVHLLRQGIAHLDTFEGVYQQDPKHSAQPAALASGPQDIDDALLWGRQLGIDGVIFMSLEVEGPPADEPYVWVQGYIAIADVASGRTLLFEAVHHSYDVADVQSATEPIDPDAKNGQSWRPQHMSGPIGRDALHLAALQDFTHAFAQRLTAHYEGEQVTLFVDSKVPQSERAIAALIVGDWSAAVNIYQSGVREINSWTTPKWVQARAHYNLGTTLAFGGCPKEGLEELRIAQRLAPSELFMQQIARAERYRAGSRPTATIHRLWQCRRGSNNAPECVHVRSL